MYASALQLDSFAANTARLEPVSRWVARPSSVLAIPTRPHAVGTPKSVDRDSQNAARAMLAVRF